MINQINEKLKAMGSNFRTEDGTTLIMHVGSMIFLKRHFEAEQECLNFVSKGEAL